MYRVVLTIMKIIKKFVYFDSPVHYLIIALYIVLSYLQELVDKVPYLHVRPDPNADQSTLLMIVELLACNPIHAGWISDGAMYRVLDQLHGMYIVDEPEIKELSRKIFLGGFNKKSGGVIVSDRRDPRKYLRFEVFGTKLIGGTKGIADPALRSRFIVIRMPVANKSKQLDKFILTDCGHEIKEVAEELKKLQQDKIFEEKFKTACLNLREGIRKRHGDLFDSLFALAEILDGQSPKKIFLNLTRQFAADQIYEREMDDRFIDPSMIVLFSVWKYVKPLLKKPGFAEHKYFWAEGMYREVKKDLESYLGKPPFEFDDVKDLGAILDDHGILLGPVKRKPRRVRVDEDEIEAGRLATHYHLHVDKLREFGEELSKQYEEADKDEPEDRRDL